MENKWTPIVGAPLVTEKNKLVFKGGVRKDEQSEQEVSNMGLYLCDQFFTGGTIRAKAKFTGKSIASCFEIVLSYDPMTSATLNAGVPAHSYPLFSIREYRNGKWNHHASTGDRMLALEVGREYEFKTTVAGSLVSLCIDGVEVLRSNLSKPIGQSQVGFFCIDQTDIYISEFEVKNEKPKAFVICQFSAPYDDVYFEVIQKVCSELAVDVVRVDEVLGPGLIIADINRLIIESTLVIADISPLNANVFYEVGYAHGLNKPTILIADKSTKLPFDVSPFRTLFYENSIGGKPKLESGLRDYMKSILRNKNMGSNPL